MFRQDCNKNLSFGFVPERLSTSMGFEIRDMLVDAPNGELK
jgi:hypothetical protein